MNNVEFETAKLLAHFKVQAKRSGISADLSLLLTSETYALAIFQEVEDVTEDEDLLATMLRLRAKLLKPVVTPPAAPSIPAIESTAAPVTTAAAPAKPSTPTPFLRDYRNGARG